jgi:hypothetical protein
VTLIPSFSMWLLLHTVPSPLTPLIVCVVNAGGVFSPW